MNEQLGQDSLAYVKRRLGALGEELQRQQSLFLGVYESLQRRLGALEDREAFAAAARNGAGV
jgi:hypothetical protein